MERFKRTLKSEIQGTVLFEEPMKRHTTYKTGGPAEVLVIPASVEDVRVVLRTTYEVGVPLFVMGRGSNLLVHDGGLRGVVMRLGRNLGAIEVQGQTIMAQAGARLPKVANIAARQGLRGLEWSGGIPGTIGGAVAMNAGAHGGETSDTLTQVVTVTRQGDIYVPSIVDMGFGYRQSTLVRDQELVVVEATFELQEDDPQVVRSEMNRFADVRKMTQPLNVPSSGSVFKNPEGDFAGRLVERLGMKGFQVGGAAVSDVHGNFIVNKGHARSDEVLEIIRTIRTRVQEEFGIELETEVEFVGWGNDGH